MAIYKQYLVERTRDGVVIEVRTLLVQDPLTPPADFVAMPDECRFIPGKRVDIYPDPDVEAFLEV